MEEVEELPPFDIRDEVRENNLLLDNFTEEDRVLEHIRNKKAASAVIKQKPNRDELMKEFTTIKQSFSEILSTIRTKRDIIDEAAVKVSIYNESQASPPKLLAQVQEALTKESQEFKTISSSLDSLYRQITTIFSEL